MKILKTVWYVLSLALLNGCVPFWSARLVKNDLDRARTEATKYYRQEVMHNLVKAANGQMFVHVDITQLNSSAVFGVNSNEGGSRSAVSSTGAVTRLFSWNIVPSGSNSVNFNSSPVIDNPKLYSHYIDFINLGPTTETRSPAAARSHDAAKVNPPPAVTRPWSALRFDSWLKATREDRTADSDATEKRTPTDTRSEDEKKAAAAKTGSPGSVTDVSGLNLSGVDAKKRNTEGLIDTLHYQAKPEDPKTPHISRKTRQIFKTFEEINGDYSHAEVIYSVCKSRQRPRAGTYIRETLLVPNRASYDLDDFDDPNEFYYWIPIECKEQYFAFCMAIVGRAATSSGIPPQKAPIIVKSL